TVPLNAYTHVAATFNPATQEMKIYLNGADSPTTLVSGSTTVSEILDSTAPVRIGAVAGGGIIPFAGAIDEISLYNTALTPAQVQSIYNTGRGGKCKPALTTNELSVAVTNTPAAQNQNFTFTATVTNHGSMTANNVTLTANLPANLNFVSADAGCTFNSSSRRVTCIIGTIAAGFSDNEAINPTEQSSEFSPAASISKQIVVQQTTQGISQTNFTATADEADPVIANNLFAASVNVLAPTSASVFIGGRVTTADGRGIKNALITLVQANGNTRTVSSGASGNYRFADVAVGQTVMLQVTAKRFRFLPNTRFVNVMEDIDNADFSAQP
ncbi:MAG TPA: LamG-like jellyroll fold domain-containing protein, partial [Pyrinomonadaceae bacterium]|nr:LamG-like jellyroll fold domain-containing protein [Pyrinomonadaceae bacterium]